MSERLSRIIEENKKFEKESPYNFCDRWCERCPHEKQVRCRIYLDEFECKATCIAHGKDENDLEVTKAVLEAQYKEVDGMLNEHIDKIGINLDNSDIDDEEFNEKDAVDFEDLPPDIQKHIRFVENNPLDATAKNYSDKAHVFLEKTYYLNEKAHPTLKYDFETANWYHTLLPVKMHRALCGFHEPASEGDISLCDAVAQFEICKKSAGASIEALQKIKEHFPTRRTQIMELVALLHNISSRIEVLLEGI